LGERKRRKKESRNRKRKYGKKLDERRCMKNNFSDPVIHLRIRKKGIRKDGFFIERKLKKNWETY
jgi:hypothetical protein